MGPNEPENTTPPVAPKQPEGAELVNEPIESAPVETSAEESKAEVVTEPTGPAIASEESSVTPAPEQPMPAEGASPQETLPQLPVKKSKKGLIIGLIIAVAVLVVLGIGAAVYALVYNNPQNAVIDAFTKAMSATSGSMTGVVSVKEQDTTVKVALSGATNTSEQAMLDATVTISTGGKDYVLKGHFVGTKDAAYVKLDDLKSVITNVLGSEYSDVIDTYYGSLLKKVDGKWVVVKQSDVSDLSSGSVNTEETQCVQTEVAKLRTDKSLQNELKSVYEKNPLFTITSKGSDASGNHYSLTPAGGDSAKNFTNALVETTFFKSLDNCTSTDLKKQLTDGATSEESSSSTATGTFDVWVDGWSHNLNKIAFSVKDDNTEMTGELYLKFNNNSAITVPTGETTVDELKTEIQKIQQQMLSSYDYTY